MTHVLSLDGVEQLAVVERSGLIESRHLGAAIVLDRSGQARREIGDVNSLVYPRSSLKLLQAVAMLRAGLGLAGDQLVLAAASHAGTPAHVLRVEAILAGAGLDASALQCPRAWPLDSAARDAIILAGGSRTRVTMTCSGKHAAFLATCVVNRWPTDTYLDANHPLQQIVRSTVEELTGQSVEHSGIDGCGAPVHAVTLHGLATAVQRTTGPAADSHGARLTAAIRAHSWAIDGPGRPDTVVADRLGIVAKFGAEGVMVMGAPDGTAVALKVLDGSLRAGTLVALELLIGAGAVDEAATRRVIATTVEPVLGGGLSVGELRATV